MDDIEEIIEEELDNKSIEKDNSISAEIIDDNDTIEKPKKSKKVRSEAQIKAFEKARIKRQENYEKRKLLKEAEKQEKKEVKTKIKEEINNLSTEEIKEKIKEKPKLVRQNAVPQQPQYPQYNYHQPPTPIINNYYYNTPPPQQEEPVKKGRKKKIVYVSDSDEEILNEPAPAPAPPPAPKLQPKKAPVNPKPILKYKFAV